jgi:hypothetical protein
VEEAGVEAVLGLLAQLPGHEGEEAVAAQLPDFLNHREHRPFVGEPRRQTLARDVEDARAADVVELERFVEGFPPRGVLEAEHVGAVRKDVTQAPHEVREGRERHANHLPAVHGERDGEVGRAARADVDEAADGVVRRRVNRHLIDALRARVEVADVDDLRGVPVPEEGGVREVEVAERDVHLLLETLAVNVEQVEFEFAVLRHVVSSPSSEGVSSRRVLAPSWRAEAFGSEGAVWSGPCIPGASCAADGGRMLARRCSLMRTGNSRRVAAAVSRFSRRRVGRREVPGVVDGDDAD